MEFQNKGNEVFLTIKIPYIPDVKVSLQKARFLTEKEKAGYTGFHKDDIMVAVDEGTELPYLSYDNSPERPMSGSFGDDKILAWIISQDEWNAYIALNNEKEEVAKEKEIKLLKSTLAHGRAQSSLLTEAELGAGRGKYGDFRHDDRADSNYVTKERFDEASARLRELGVEPRPWRDDSAPVNEIVLADGYGWKVKFTESGWELLEQNPKNRGYLHVNYDSPDYITDKLKEVVMTYWADHPREWPGLGGTPQTKYELSCSEFNKKRTGNKYFLA